MNSDEMKEALGQTKSLGTSLASRALGVKCIAKMIQMYPYFFIVKGNNMSVHILSKLKESSIENTLNNQFQPFLSVPVVVAEWLRRWTRNPLGSPRVGSNPADYVQVFF